MSGRLNIDKALFACAFAATKSIKVSVKADFEVLSLGILGTFAGIIELQGTTVMKYEG